MKTRFIVFALMIICALLVSCSKLSQLQTDPSEETQSYPLPELSSVINESYPVEGAESNFPQGPKFTIFTPVLSNDIFVYGTGPAGVPIKLVSVSEVGTVLSETAINIDGTFSFALEASLVSGHVIGLQLGDISGTDFVEMDFLYSETYFERPMIGILFDMVIVE